MHDIFPTGETTPANSLGYLDAESQLQGTPGFVVKITFPRWRTNNLPSVKTLFRGVVAPSTRGSAEEIDSS